MAKHPDNRKSGGGTGGSATPTSSADSETQGAASRRSGTIGSLAKGLRILEFVAGAPSLVRLRTIAAHFSMDRSAAFRFLATLEQFGYVSKDQETKAYSLGPGLARIRRLSRSRGELIELARPFLKRLSEQTGQTSFVAMIENNRALLLEVAPGNNIVGVYVGQDEPLYCTAAGKAVLALLPRDEQDQIIRDLNLKKSTPRTTSSKSVLRRELDEIRASGIAFDDREWHDDLCCIGAPIVDETGYPLAAISLSMIDASIEGGPRAQTQWIERVRQSALDASRSLAEAETNISRSRQRPSGTSG
jgi:DNA-binding IclR family transcriptional regulator